ncbi:hypothetical protein CEXT_690601 [Caerostris extrusa]|uniref:Maturase K n=1 Tax=Caerostris extrusa TaxID=172846 RepID=A0AAV4MKM8_CAEEX|nr:hypothetical protein CEXT_690601 [Caerostris extrusa]
MSILQKFDKLNHKRCSKNYLYLNLVESRDGLNEIFEECQFLSLTRSQSSRYSEDHNGMDPHGSFTSNNRDHYSLALITKKVMVPLALLNDLKAIMQAYTKRFEILPSINYRTLTFKAILFFPPSQSTP